MKALKIIPSLVALLILVYLGVVFVEQNDELVVLTLGSREMPALRLGFIVMTSVVVGILIGAILASIQIVLLIVQNRSLRKQVNRGAENHTPVPAENTDPESDPFTQ